MRSAIANKKLIVSLFAVTTLILTSCSDGGSPSARDSQGNKVDCTGVGTIDANAVGSKTLASECEVPAFPTQVKDYVLDRTVDGQSIRLFEGENWRPFLTPYRAGNTISCQPELWIVRWRSQNPAVKVSISGTYGGFDAGDPTNEFGEVITDGSFNEETDWVAFYEPENGEGDVGSAGYFAGPSCSQPIMKWNSNPAGDANLADISFEYQIWTFKPKI